MTYPALLATLATRFAQNPSRHPGLEWSAIQTRLEGRLEKMQSLNEMANTGGEPDVIGQDAATGEYLFCDCSAETPIGRRSLCYDRAGLDARKEAKPANSALDVATALGIELLTEDQYRHLQSLGRFDTKTSSWLQTPAEVRQLGGALYGDFRYGRVFIYHNGASAYYAVRGFRGLLRV